MRFPLEGALMIATLGCVGYFGFVTPVDAHDPQPVATMELSEAAQFRLAYAEDYQADPRWVVPDQREGLCIAWVGALNAASEDGPLPPSMTYWMPDIAPAPYAVHRAIEGEYGASPAVEAFLRLQRDKRWALPQQRGPLCNALFHSAQAVRALPAPAGT